MKCYINEINKLTKENMENKVRIRNLEHESDMLEREYKTSCYGMDIISYEIRNRAYGLNYIQGRHYEILKEIKKLYSTMVKNEQLIEHLRTEYRKLHTNEFYKPLEEFEIGIIIAEGGSIKGIKF